MMVRIFKRSGASDQGQPRFKKRAQGQEEPKSVKVKLEKGGGSQNVKPHVSLCQETLWRVSIGYKEFLWLL